jgi:hypothetical protein
VYGKRGIGKSSYFHGIKSVRFDHEILKSKESTVDFMNMMRYSFMPLVLDDFDLVESLPGTKELSAVPLRVPFYIISNDRLALEIITEHYEFPGVPVEDFANALGVSLENARLALEKSKGNMTSAKLDLKNFKSERDVFMDSKQYVKSLIQSDSVCEHLNKYLAEHGNTSGIVHENYLDFTSSPEIVMHSMSDADLIDKKIYSDMSWDLMRYFNLSACLIPSKFMSSNNSDMQLRPGSVWTKMSNMLMKRNRLKKLGMHRDDIQVWVEYANAGDDITKHFDSYDLDSLNQLSLTKIKSRVLTSLKKKCRKTDAKKSAAEESR